MAKVQLPPELLDDYEHTLEMLDKALVSIRVLMRAHQSGRKLPVRVVRNIDKQCTAAAVVSRRMRKEVRRLKGPAADR